MRRFQHRFQRAAFLGITLLLLLRTASALGETSVSFTPLFPRVGDYVDVNVTTDSGSVKGIRYHLSLDGEKIFSSRKAESRTATSFRPRKEGVYTLEVTVLLPANRTETTSIAIPVSGSAPVQRGADIIYSQMDGWWRQVLYTGSHAHTLESSGCAVFTLSHALQRLGLKGDEVLPDRLVGPFGQYYSEGLGARSEALFTQAGLRFGYETAHRLVTAEDEIVSFLARGDLFTLGIVKRHTVLVDGIDTENRKIHIVDSCPETTFEKLGRTPAYIRLEDGTWQTVCSAEEIPGTRWFFETSRFGGAGYWLDLDFCAKRGLRLIRRPWLTLVTADGEISVSPDTFGPENSTVTVSRESRTVPTAALRWTCDGADGPLLAVVTGERSVNLTHRNGDRVEKYGAVPAGSTLAALRVNDERVYVYWRGMYAYLGREDVELKTPGS